MMLNNQEINMNVRIIIDEKNPCTICTRICDFPRPFATRNYRNTIWARPRPSLCKLFF